MVAEMALTSFTGAMFDQPIDDRRLARAAGTGQDDDPTRLCWPSFRHVVPPTFCSDFPHPFDRRLDLDDRVRDFHIVRLGTDGIHFADHFLCQEIELAPADCGWRTNDWN